MEQTVIPQPRQIYVNPLYHLMTAEEIAKTYGFQYHVVVRAIAKLNSDDVPARLRVTVHRVEPNTAYKMIYITEHTVLRKLLPFLRGEETLPEKKP